MQILEELYASDKAEFAAVYGRRRIGKTFLTQVSEVKLYNII